MFYHPDLIVITWMMPVIFLILIPSALAAFRICTGCIKKSSAAVVSIESRRSVIENSAIAEA